MVNQFRNAKRWLELKRQKYGYRNYYIKLRHNYTIEHHIKEAANWLKRAQDWGDDKGVSYGTKFGEGFMKSYPETTGYIIPTFMKLSEFFSNPEYIDRAVKMGDWEITIQMDCGAIMAGMVNNAPTPAVFNTGQVMFGWNALYRLTGCEKYLCASRKAADWLLSIQAPEGSWSTFNSKYAKTDSTLYNVRTAWALGQLGQIIDEKKYVLAAIKNADFTLEHQIENGWFGKCCLDLPEKPLLHTIAYTMRGLLEIGLLTGKDEYIDAASITANSLFKLLNHTGFIPGRINSKFKTAANYACLTGSAQTAIVWAKLYKLHHEHQLREAVKRVNRFLMERHNVIASDLSIRGGITGSWPVDGEYGRFTVLNWATKFFIDSLLEEIDILRT